jgi:hypothetical protein
MKKVFFILFISIILTGCSKTQPFAQKNLTGGNNTKQKDNQEQIAAKQFDFNDPNLDFTFEYPNEWAETKFSKLNGDPGYNFQINFDNSDIYIYGETNDFVPTGFPGNNELIPRLIFQPINISKSNFFPNQTCSNLPNVDYINDCDYVDLDKNGNPDVVIVNVGYQIPPEPKPMYIARLAFVKNEKYDNFVFVLPLDELDDGNVFNTVIEKNINEIKVFDQLISTIKFKE